jgi:hypothetical protein
MHRRARRPGDHSAATAVHDERAIDDERTGDDHDHVSRPDDRDHDHHAARPDDDRALRRARVEGVRRGAGDPDARKR